MRQLALLCCCLLWGCPKEEGTEDPKAHAEGVYLMATAAYMRGDFPEAHKLLDEVKVLNPTDPRIPAAEGELYLAEYKLTEALEAFLKAVKIDPKRGTNYSRIGYIQSMKGDRPAALESLKKALELNPNDFNALESIGDLQLKDGKWEDAVASFLRASEATPDNMKGQLVLRAVQEQSKHGQAEPALKTLETAWKKGIKDTQLLTELGDRLVTAARLQEAIDVYTAAAKGSKDDPTIWELVGELYSRLDKPGDAEAAFRESLKLKDRGVVHVALARLCEKRKDDACLKTELDAALTTATGEEPREVTELADLLASAGRRADGWKLLAELANEDAQKGDGALQLRAARMAKEVGDKAAVKEHCARALASDAGVKKCP